MAVNGYVNGELHLEASSSEKVCNGTLYCLTRPGLATELSIMKQLQNLKNFVISWLVMQ